MRIFNLPYTMMQSIAIILICIIVKPYDCSAVSVDSVKRPMRLVAAPMPSAVVNDDDMVRITSDRRNAIHAHIGDLQANDDVDDVGDRNALDESSQPSKHDNEVTVMNQTKNNVNDSGNRAQPRPSHHGDDDAGQSDSNGPRLSRAKREGERQDICDTQCVCRNDENFLTVECNFKQVSQSSR